MERKYVDDLLPGMILARPVTVLDKSGRVLLEQGLVITPEHIRSLEEWSIVDVFVEEAEEEKLESSRRDVFEDALKRLSLNAHYAAVNSFKDTLGDLSQGGKGAAEKMNSSLSQILEVLDLDKNQLLKITFTQPSEDYIFNHAVNVCVLSLVIGGYIGFNEDEKRMLGEAALLHDIGLVDLDPECWDHVEFFKGVDENKVKEHITRGEEMISRIEGISPMALKVQRKHHERCDGSGIPKGLKADELDTITKIIAVADVFASLTKPFSEDLALTGQEALKHMFKNMEKYDTRILKGFLGDLAIFPIGSIVKLSSGIIALVVGTVKNQPFRPILWVISDPQGRKLDKPYKMDLSQKKNMLFFIECTLKPSDVGFEIEWE